MSLEKASKTGRMGVETVAYRLNPPLLRILGLISRHYLFTGYLPRKWRCPGPWSWGEAEHESKATGGPQGEK